MSDEGKYRSKLGLQGSPNQGGIAMRARQKTILLNNQVMSDIKNQIGLSSGTDMSNSGMRGSGGLSGNSGFTGQTVGVSNNAGALDETAFETPFRTNIKAESNDYKMDSGVKNTNDGFAPVNVNSADNFQNSNLNGGFSIGANQIKEPEISSNENWERNVSGNSVVSRSFDKISGINSPSEQPNTNFGLGGGSSFTNSLNAQQYTPQQHESIQISQNDNSDWGTDNVKTIKQSDFDWERIDNAFDAAEKAQTKSVGKRSASLGTIATNSVESYGQGEYQAGLPRQSTVSLSNAQVKASISGVESKFNTIEQEDNNVQQLDDQFEYSTDMESAQAPYSQPVSQKFNNVSSVRPKEEKKLMDNSKQGFSFNPKNAVNNNVTATATASTNNGIKPVTRQRRGKIIAFLVSFDTEPNGEIYEIAAGRWLITSKPSEHSDYILIEEDTISPLHAFIRAMENGRIQVLDQLSEYGTFVTAPGSDEEEEIAGAMATLEHGSVVRFGNRRFVLTLVPPIA